MYESSFSTEIASIPGNDNDPPVSEFEILTPSVINGNSTYISPSTLIKLKADDYGIVPSGVETTFYRVDNGPYAVYSEPFSLSATNDGAHVIHYYSTDRRGNIEAEKTISVVLDSLAPTSAISASDPLIEGGTNTVSTMTRFTLSATDAGVGSPIIMYRIGGGRWIEYATGFTLPGAGSQSIGYKSKDALGNEESEKIVNVKVISLSVSKEAKARPVVLAGAWGGTKSTQTAIDSLVAYLDANKVSYYVPESEDEFTSALRSGDYSTYVLIDFSKEGLASELRESVHYGSGLVYIKTQSDDPHGLGEMLGVSCRGMSTNKDMDVQIASGALGDSLTLKTSGKAVKTSIISTGQGLGYVTDKSGESYPVVVLNEYGNGKTALFAFDLLSSTDKAKASALVLAAIEAVTPDEQAVHALADAGVEITVRNSSEPAQIKITETLPDGVDVISTDPNVQTSGGSIEWTASLSSNEEKGFYYTMRLPDAAGTYMMQTKAQYQNQGTYRNYDIYGVELKVAYGSAELKTKLIDALNRLALIGNEAEHRAYAVEDLGLVIDTATDAPNMEANITHIYSAADELLKVSSTDITDTRLMLDELLRIWEKKWAISIQGSDVGKDK